MHIDIFVWLYDMIIYFNLPKHTIIKSNVGNLLVRKSEWSKGFFFRWFLGLKVYFYKKDICYFEGVRSERALFQSFVSLKKNFP